MSLICCIKVGRYEYEIGEHDRFMDNGFCIQLITQKIKNHNNWDVVGQPQLSKRAANQLKKYKRIEHTDHNYGKGVRIFSLQK